MANDCSVFSLHVDHFKLYMNILILLYSLIISNQILIILNFLKTFFLKKFTLKLQLPQQTSQH